MGYNYTRSYFERHRDLISRLVDIGSTGEILKIESDDAASIQRYRHVVNNILTVMELYQPEDAHLRKKIRTWTSVDKATGHWILYVGIPRGVNAILGRPPGLQIQFQSALGGIPPEPVRTHALSTATSWHFDKTITEMDDFVRFIGQIKELPSNIVQATAELLEPLPDEALIFFKPVYELGWYLDPVSLGTTTIVLNRTLEPDSAHV